MKPSLYQEAYIRSFSNYCKIEPENIEIMASCIGHNLPSLVEEITGININKPPYTVLSINFDYDCPEINYSELEGINLMKLRVVTYVTYTGYLILCFQHNDGRKLDYFSKDFNCNDVKFWIKEFPLKEFFDIYYSQPRKLPFKLPKLKYELQFFGLVSEHISISIELIDSSATNSKICEQLIEDKLKDYNKKSIANDYKFGVVHNFNFENEGKNLIAHIDFGSASLALLKEILMAINLRDFIMKVII